MKKPEIISKKILSLHELQHLVAQWKFMGKTVAFTNGCFDILHEGHIHSLSEAAREADYLIVGLNADSSVKKLKGESRPINHQQARALVLASLIMVDAVTIFEEDTPLGLIKALLPDVLVKGGDYTVDQIAGSTEVIENGGRVKIVPLVPGISTTGIIQQMQHKGR